MFTEWFFSYRIRSSAQEYTLDGQLTVEDVPVLVLCKPKLLPLKSVTLDKLEKMQQEAQELLMQQEAGNREQRERAQ
ncbi:BBSome-interacting protein 1 [Bagarius yarrelli]|uniref:BBSome-interacting protein 1 n=1 Tax=Bagarius yarrelli TaxID=175774 RepID=A0A556TTZ2_BAGYA|nr:BBSome-interacting protein 1 [Bagarius yarrelli]